MKLKHIFTTVLCFLTCTLYTTSTQSQVGGKAGSTSYTSSAGKSGQGGTTFIGVSGNAGRANGGTISTGGSCNVNCTVTPHLPVCTLQNSNCGGNCKSKSSRGN